MAHTTAAKPADATALGRALLDCLRQSQGSYVLIRKGHRRDRENPEAPAIPEYRVNLRLVDGTDLTGSGPTVQAALQRAAVRMRDRA